MEMVLESKEIQALLALLAFELFGKEMHLNVSEINWNEVFEAGEKHAVAALLYPGLKKLDGVPVEVVDRARSAAAMSAMQTEHMLQEQSVIIETLATNNIPCAILKGFSVACCYPHPELRVPGDIDVLVSPDNLEKASNIMQELGYRYESETEMHKCFYKGDVALELHQKTSIYPDTEKGNYASSLMESALSHINIREIAGVKFPVLSDVYQLVSLLAHMERHMGSSGISLRQLCDWLVTMSQYGEDISSDIVEIIKKCGLFKFAQIVTRIGEKYLGLPKVKWISGVKKSIDDEVLEDIMSVGNFHEQQSERHISSAMMQSHRNETGKSRSLLSNYIHTVQSIMSSSFPWAKSNLWIPLFSIYLPMRWVFRVITGKRKKANILSAVRIAKERGDLMKEMELYR